jgi:hypothetical protein
VASLQQRFRVCAACVVRFDEHLAQQITKAAQPLLDGARCKQAAVNTAEDNEQAGAADECCMEVNDKWRACTTLLEACAALDLKGSSHICAPAATNTHAQPRSA